MKNDNFVKKFKEVAAEYSLNLYGDVYYEILYDYDWDMDRIFIHYAKYEENDLASVTELREEELPIYKQSLEDAGLFAGPVLFALRARNEFPCYNIFERIACQPKFNGKYPSSFFEITID